MASSSTTKRVLILGAGYCCKPLVDYLSGHGYEVTVGSRTLSRAQDLCANAPGTTNPIEIDVEKPEGAAKLEEECAKHFLVISMLPWLLHGVAAGCAIRQGAHFLTTSYVQPPVRALEEEAIRKGLVILNECGVDPGTDHMAAMKIIDNAHAQNGQVKLFSSFCGGLPHPEDNDNPFGYKFSWAPRGVLLAGGQPAKFYRDGEEVSIPPGSLFRRPNFSQGVQVDAAEFLRGVQFDTYPNRDSTPYREIYGIPEARSLIRGTMRYTNWCDIVQALSDIGFLDTTTRTLDVEGREKTYLSLLKTLLGLDAGVSVSDVEEALKQRLVLPEGMDGTFVIDALRWLGLFSDVEISTNSPKVLSSEYTTLDVLCDLMQSKMVFTPGQRDLLLLQHYFEIEYPDRVEKLTSTLVELGTKEGVTAMSRTVALPAAIAARLILEGKFTKPGLSIPTIPELYVPILQELEEKFAIAYVEKLISSSPRAMSE